MRVRSRGLMFGALALVALGVVLLLNNFYIISGFNVSALLPLVFVILGAVILLRGDLGSTESRNFGITRGSVESATLEVHAGEIDVRGRALTLEGRLIAGQYAADSRPALEVQETHAFLKMERSATPWLSFADWDISFARDLPWDIFVSTSLGHVTLDLTGLIVTVVNVGTGLGDIRVTCPQEAFDSINLQSAIGNIQFLSPVGVRARVTVRGSRVFRVRVDDTRYEQVEPNVYVTRNADSNAPLVNVTIRGTLGDAYLA